MILTLLALPAFAADPAPGGALDAAWQKELAYLEAEKRSVQARLVAEQRRIEADLAAREAALDTAQGRVLSLGRAADAAEDTLAAARRDAESTADGQDALSGVLDGAAATYTLTLPPVPDDATPDAAAAAQAESLRLVFAAAADDLRASSGVRTEDGAFFLPDGTQVEGRILRAGHVAAWGVSDRGAGALFPVGEGRLQISGSADADEARAVLAGTPPANPGVFLFEGPDKRLEEEKGKSFADIMEAGGAIGWVIVGLGAVLALLTALRAFILVSAGRGMARLEVEAIQTARTGDRGRLAALLAGRHVPIARILRAVVEASPAPRDHLEDAAANALDRETTTIERFGTALLVIASVAPLLGLLGTVTGMIGTFDVITEHGTGNPKLLSGGISEALVTTELGLVVAIPGVLLGNLLNARARTLLARLEGAALSLVHVLTGGPRDTAHVGRAPAVPEADRDAGPPRAHERVA